MLFPPPTIPLAKINVIKLSKSNNVPLSKCIGLLYFFLFLLTISYVMNNVQIIASGSGNMLSWAQMSRYISSLLEALIFHHSMVCQGPEQILL